MATEIGTFRKGEAAADQRVELGDGGSLGVHLFMEFDEATIVRVVHQPGWRWSAHLRQPGGPEMCQATHIGYTIAGREHVRLADGTEFDLRAGEAYVVPPGHDAWVVGAERYEGVNFVPREG